MASGLIIVVDDDPNFRKLYSDFLTVHGYTVMTSKSGAHAMKLLLNCTPKVLILDISMPGMDGIETCKQIRQFHGSDLPIVFLTSFTDIDKLRDCLHAGGDDYLIKSDKLDSILERIKFWSAAPNRQEARLRRTEVMREVDNTIERIDQTVDESNDDCHKTDSMSRLMVTAQSHADEAMHTGRDNKLFVFGYTAEIVSQWADTQLGVKARYLDYLRAALSGSNLLKREDIDEVMDDFDRISVEPLFLLGRKRAQAAFQEAAVMKGGAVALENDSAPDHAGA